MAFKVMCALVQASVFMSASPASWRLVIHLSLTVPLPEAVTVAQERALGAPGVIPFSKAILLTLSFAPHSAFTISIMLMFSSTDQSHVHHNKML